MDSNSEYDIIWQPHPGAQTDALKRTEFEILYGGARGGGKTDAGIAWLTREVGNPHLRALIIRRNADDLRDWVDRAEQVFSKLGARKMGKPTEFHWPSGAIFRTGHLKDEAAYTKYQGHEYQRMLIEELTQIPTEKAYLRLISSCRSTVKNLEPRVFLTTNPGGLGHGWVKKRFIDAGPWGEPQSYTEELFDNKVTRSRIFIPAKIDDNPTLVKNDPGYVLTIEQLKDTDPELYKAWRYGDWDTFVGQVFREFSRDKHVVPRMTPTKKLHHFLGVDWGYTGRESHEGAFAALAMVMYKESFKGEDFNRVVVYKEWYGKEKTPYDWADIIYKESPYNYSDAVCDSSMYNNQSDGSKPTAQMMHERWDQQSDGYWLRFKPGTKNRISRVAALHNWFSLAPDGSPYLTITENCTHLIRTIPMLVYDETKVEDVDTDSEDHLYDALTYMLTYLKFTSPLGEIDHNGSYWNKQKKMMDPKEALLLTEFEKSKKPKRRDWRT